MPAVAKTSRQASGFRPLPSVKGWWPGMLALETWRVEGPDRLDLFDVAGAVPRCPLTEWSEDPEGSAFIEDMMAIGYVIARAR